jgi:hypothetical protein
MVTYTLLYINDHLDVSLDTTVRVYHVPDRVWRVWIKWQATR